MFVAAPAASTIGGLIGATIVGAGFAAVDYGVVVSKLLLPGHHGLGADRGEAGAGFHRRDLHRACHSVVVALGFTLSTTQVASGSVIGSELGRKGAKVRWNTAVRIGVDWLLTLPAAGGVGALAAWVAHLGVRASSSTQSRES